MNELMSLSASPLHTGRTFQDNLRSLSTDAPRGAIPMNRVSDRIYVMHEGEMTGLIEGEDMKNLTEELVVGYATGTKANV